MALTMTTEDVFEVVRRITLEVLPELEAAQITIDGVLTDLGANSIDRADIVTMSTEALGITVPVVEFKAVRNIRTLVAVLERNL